VTSAAKVASLEDTVAWRDEERRAGRRVVFTNGCFDILHVGHVRCLAEARRQALGPARVAAQAGRHAAGADLEDPTERVLVGARPVDRRAHARVGLGIQREELRALA